MRQLDWAHVLRAVRSAAPDGRRRQCWQRQLCRGELAALTRTVRQHQRRGWGDRDLLGKVRREVEEQGSGWRQTALPTRETTSKRNHEGRTPWLDCAGAVWYGRSL